jgi:hypothetical protein
MMPLTIPKKKEDKNLRVKLTQALAKAIAYYRVGKVSEAQYWGERLIGEMRKVGIVGKEKI